MKNAYQLDPPLTRSATYAHSLVVLGKLDWSQSSVTIIMVLLVALTYVHIQNPLTSYFSAN